MEILVYPSLGTVLTSTKPIEIDDSELVERYGKYIDIFGRKLDYWIIKTPITMENKGEVEFTDCVLLEKARY